MLNVFDRQDHYQSDDELDDRKRLAFLTFLKKFSCADVYFFLFFYFSLLAVVDRRAARVFLVLSTTGHLSLFPLLFQSQGKL